VLLVASPPVQITWLVLNSATCFATWRRRIAFGLASAGQDSLHRLERLTVFALASAVLAIMWTAFIAIGSGWRGSAVASVRQVIYWLFTGGRQRLNLCRHRRRSRFPGSIVPFWWGAFFLLMYQVALCIAFGPAPDTFSRLTPQSVLPRLASGMAIINIVAMLAFVLR